MFDPPPQRLNFGCSTQFVYKLFSPQIVINLVGRLITRWFMLKHGKNQTATVSICHNIIIGLSVDYRPICR